MAAAPAQEMIELKNLELEKRIDLTRGTPERPVRLERTNALRITPGKVPELLSRVRQIRLLGGQNDPRLTGQLGEGHAFRPCTRGQQTWCDLCGDFVWGGPRKSLQCAREYRSGPPLQGGAGSGTGRGWVVGPFLLTQQRDPRPVLL